MSMDAGRRDHVARSKKAPIVESRVDDFNLYVKDDGFDYWGLIEQFRMGFLPVRELKNRHPDVRRVFVVEADGRKLLLKWEMAREKSIEKLAWQFFTAPFYSRLMRKVNKAVNAGCDVMQDMYLVAERVSGRICREAFAITDYIEGRHITTPEEERRHGQAIIDAMRTLHAHGLAVCDIHHSNMLVTDDGVKFIDLTCRGTTLLSQAKDVARLKARLNLHLDVSGVANKLAVLFEYALEQFRETNRRLKRAS